jgi:hypothetical protein
VSSVHRGDGNGYVVAGHDDDGSRVRPLSNAMPSTSPMAQPIKAWATAARRSGGSHEPEDEDADDDDDDDDDDDTVVLRKRRQAGATGFGVPACGPSDRWLWWA